MKKIMEQLLEGKYEYVVPKLRLSTPAITVLVKVGEDYQGDFFFGTKDNSIVKGMLFSSNRRIILSRDSFTGNTIPIAYRVDLSGLEAGDICQGTIIICSNLGEYKIPIEITVAGETVQTSQGNLYNLKQFADLAKHNYKEAFRLYTKEAFKYLLKNEKQGYEELYRGLSKNPITYQHMEEFLIACGQKEAVKITLDKQTKELLNIESSMKDSIYISKNTWGNLRLEIEVEGDFLEAEKKLITSEDFIGSVYGLEYVIMRERLKEGRHYGKIYIRSIYETLEVQIIASSSREYEVNNKRFEKKIQKELTRDYLMLLTKQLEYRTWKERTLSKLNDLKEAGCFELLHRLAEIYLYYAEDNAAKTLDAMMLLKGQSFSKAEYEEEGLYLYLGKQTGLIASDKLDVSQRIETLYRKHQDSFMLLWLLLQVSEEFINAPVKQLYMLERQYELGCNSPFLYLEATKLIIKEEGLFKKLSAFMVQVIRFASRHEMLTEDMIMRIAHLANREKRFSEGIYRVLKRCYEKYPNNDILEAICKIVMLGNPRQRKYFKWYQLAIQEDIRITRLYEFYVETMNRKDKTPLPREVKLYFAYNNTLGSNTKAFVYANIIRNKEQDMEMYERYVDIIKAFVQEALKAKKINEDYAIIYHEFLAHIEDQETASRAVKIAFTHRLYLDDSKIRKVIVCHAPLLEERVYSCVDNVAFIDIYTEDAQILFEDSRQQRFAATINYNQQQLFDNKKIIEQCIWHDVKDDGLLINTCGSDLQKTNINIRNLASFQHIAQSKGLTLEYIQEARHKLLSYYDRHAEDSTINDYLSGIDYRDFYKVAPALLIDIMVRRDLTKEAFALICDLGYEKVPVTTLFKLCRSMIIETEFIENEELIDLAYFVLSKEKYDSLILSYLQDNYIGSVEAMIKVNEKLAGFDLDTYSMEEEILLLAMYSRIYHPKLSGVYKSYIKNRGKESVIKAFLIFLAYGYFLGDMRIDNFVFSSLEEQFISDDETDTIISLALLKRYRYCNNLTTLQKQNIISILEHCRQQDLRFAFFADLPKDCTKAFQVEDKVFVEHISTPRAEVTLYYSMQHEGEAIEYIREPLTKNYHGIFTREFLLFYGEQLTWYMAIAEDNEIIETPVKTITMAKVSQETGSKYQIINQMLADYKLNREARLEQTMDGYLRQEHLIEETFTLIE